MGRKRKRTNAEKGTEGALKRQRILGPGSATSSTKSLVVKQAVLSQYYPKVFSLREYLLSKLPPTSKVRRKKIISIGSRPDEKDAEKTLSSFLDRTLIGSSESSEPNQKERWQQWTALSQKPEDDSIASTNLSAGGIYSQSEVCFLYLLWLELECYGWTSKTSH
jgi:telomerase reverse transcriptase